MAHRTSRKPSISRAPRRPRRRARCPRPRAGRRRPSTTSVTGTPLTREPFVLPEVRVDERPAPAGDPAVVARDPAVERRRGRCRSPGRSSGRRLDDDVAGPAVRVGHAQDGARRRSGAGWRRPGSRSGRRRRSAGSSLGRQRDRRRARLRPGDRVGEPGVDADVGPLDRSDRPAGRPAAGRRPCSGGPARTTARRRPARRRACRSCRRTRPGRPGGGGRRSGSGRASGRTSSGARPPSPARSGAAAGPAAGARGRGEPTGARRGVRRTARWR